jgi:hypothetical protein
MKNIHALFCAALATALFPTPLLAAPVGDIGARARETFERHRAAVVTVQLVIKNKMTMRGMSGEARESKQEVTGTVIDASGLTVLSLSSTDPGSLVQSMLSGLGGEDDARFKMETELSDIRIFGDESEEIPAEVVLRDRDLDLAFIRPRTAPAKPLPFLDLTQNAPVQLLDEVLTINRLGRVAGRAHAASIERINAVIPKPRLFYIPGSNATATGFGCPAFTLDGKTVGLFVMRVIKSGGDSGSSMLESVPRNASPILLPSETILRVAKQVPPRKTETK